MKTHDKIILASLKLFNEKGERAVSTNHIAEYLGISPGNLYYHFRNKEDIIKSIFEKYIEHMQKSFIADDEHTPAEVFLQQYCDQVFNSFWQFRFFHSSMPGIVLRDKGLHKRYLSAHTLLGERAKYSVVKLQQDEIINIDDQDIDDLVELMRVVGSFWMNYLMANTLNGKITKAQLYRGILKIINLLWPYTTPTGKLRLSVLRERYQVLSHSKKTLT